MTSQHEFTRKGFEFVPPPIDGPLPDDFNLKERLLKCREADNAWHGAHPREQVPALLEEALAQDKWLDAYELQRLGGEYGQRVDHEQQKSLAKTIIAWAAPAFREVYPENRGRYKGIRPVDMLDVLRWSDGHLQRYPEQIDELIPYQQALCDLIFDYVLTDPDRAQYEFIALFMDHGDPPTRSSLKAIRRVLAGVSDPTRVPELINTTMQALAPRDPNAALELAVVGHGALQTTRGDVAKALETVLEHTSTEAILTYQLNTRNIIGDPDNPFVPDPAFVAHNIDHILPGAAERVEQVMLRRMLETLQRLPELSHGKAREWEVLERLQRLTEIHEIELPGELRDRIVDLATGRAEVHQDANVRVSDRLETLFRMAASNTIDAEILFGGLTELAEPYHRRLVEVGNEVAQTEGTETAQEFSDYYSEYIAYGNAISFVLRFSEAVVQYVDQEPTREETPINHVVDASLLRDIVRKYQATRIAPSAKQITKERIRLVMTYPNRAFIAAKKSEWDMKVRHPERGPRSMIYRHSLEISAAHLVASSLGLALNYDKLGALADWQRRYANGDIVQFYPDF